MATVTVLFGSFCMIHRMLWEVDMSAWSEPVVGVFGVFPLGEGKFVDDHGATPAARPFGLRFAAPPVSAVSVPAVDFSTWSYDEQRQIALVGDNGAMIEAAKHSTGPTQTPTNTADGTRFERDDDVTED
ncbi:MAG: putative ATP-grasp-modified RiPP [Sciscionella sp.]